MLQLSYKLTLTGGRMSSWIYRNTDLVISICVFTIVFTLVCLILAWWWLKRRHHKREKAAAAASSAELEDGSPAAGTGDDGVSDYEGAYYTYAAMPACAGCGTIQADISRANRLQASGETRLSISSSSTTRLTRTSTPPSLLRPCRSPLMTTPLLEKSLFMHSTSDSGRVSQAAAIRSERSVSVQKSRSMSMCTSTSTSTSTMRETTVNTTQRHHHERERGRAIPETRLTTMRTDKAQQCPCPHSPDLPIQSPKIETRCIR